MWDPPRSRLRHAPAIEGRRKRRTASVVLAVIAIIALMLASTAPVNADDGYDWEEWSDNWESSRDPGGWDAIVMLSYTRGADDYWISAEFSAYGEHVWMENRSLHRAEVTLYVEDPVEFKEWVYVQTNPGECITWGWERPPKSFPDCFFLGGTNIPEDRAVIIQICGYDPVGWTCHDEIAES